MELYNGRPADCTGRLEKEIRVYDLLEALDIPFQCTDHPAAATMDDLTETDRILGAAVCKNLLLCNRQCTEFYLLMLPGSKPFKTKYLSKQIGSSRLSFADPEYMERYLDITPGSLSVLGLMNDQDNRVQLLIDADLLNSESVGMHPCINTSSIALKTRDLLDKILPAVHHSYRSVELPWEVE